MVERGLVGVLGGLVASLALKEPMHRAGVPELARYTAGGVVILAVVYVIDRDALPAVAEALVGVGLGVGLARLLGR